MAKAITDNLRFQQNKSFLPQYPGDSVIPGRDVCSCSRDAVTLVLLVPRGNEEALRNYTSSLGSSRTPQVKGRKEG